MATTLHRVHHVGIIVVDLDESMRFYDRILGKEPDILTAVDDAAGLSRQFGVGDEPGDAKVRIAFYHVDNTSIELIEVQEPTTELVQPPVHQRGAKHICFQVDDIEAVHTAMVEEGYEFAAEPAYFDERQPKLDGVKFAYFLDPDGNFLEIMEDPSKAELLGAEQEAGLPKG